MKIAEDVYIFSRTCLDELKGDAREIKTARGEKGKQVSGRRDTFYAEVRREFGRNLETLIERHFAFLYIQRHRTLHRAARSCCSRRAGIRKLDARTRRVSLGVIFPHLELRQDSISNNTSSSFSFCQ